jgi:hypothetical protein
MKAADSATAERAELEPKLAFVTVSVENAAPDTKLKIAGEEIRRAAWGEQAPLMPGATDVVVETPGRSPVTKSVTVTAGHNTPMTIDAAGEGGTTSSTATASADTAPEAPHGSKAKLRPWAYVAGGVGVVGLVTFGIGGAIAQSKFNDLKGSCSGPCTPPRADEISAGKSAQTVANVGLVIGVIGVAAGVTLFVLSTPPKKSDPAAASASLVVSPGWIGVRGSL